MTQFSMTMDPQLIFLRSTAFDHLVSAVARETAEHALTKARLDQVIAEKEQALTKARVAESALEEELSAPNRPGRPPTNRRTKL